MRLVLLVQACALVVPIIVTGYWSLPRACQGQGCIDMAPFLVAACFLFGLPLLLVLFLTMRRRGLDRVDVSWLLAFDVYVVAASVAVTVAYGFFWSYLAMAAIALTGVASASLAVAGWRRRPTAST